MSVRFGLRLNAGLNPSHCDPERAIRVGRELPLYFGMAKRKPKRGPEAERLRLDGPWEAQIDRALATPRPKSRPPQEPPAKDAPTNRKDTKPSG